MALNRDEFLARPTDPFSAWTSVEGIPVFGGRDRTSGGTWFAVGKRVVAGLTNDRSEGIPYPGKRSRGELVTLACGARNAREAAEDIASRDPRDYGAFHLLVCDTEDMFWVHKNGDNLAATEVQAGLHVLGNLSLDAADDPVVQFVTEAVSPHLEMPRAGLTDVLKKALATNGDGKPCVHRGEYGTKSSALLWWQGNQSTLEVCEGAPCQGDFVEVSDALQAFLRD
jgi:uncharacterized protein with NRDE domain